MEEFFHCADATQVDLGVYIISVYSVNEQTMVLVIVVVFVVDVDVDVVNVSVVVFVLSWIFCC